MKATDTQQSLMASINVNPQVNNGPARYQSKLVINADQNSIYFEVSSNLIDKKKLMAKETDFNLLQKINHMMGNNDSNLHSESTDHNQNMASSGASGIKQANNNQITIHRFYKPLCNEAVTNNENTNNSAGSK